MEKSGTPQQREEPADSPSHRTHCDHCGYDISGLPKELCPECGRPPIPASQPLPRTISWYSATTLAFAVLAFDALNFLMYLPEALGRRHGEESRVILWGCGAAAIACGLVLRRLFGQGWRNVGRSRKSRARFIVLAAAFLIATHAAIYIFLYIEVN